MQAERPKDWYYDNVEFMNEPFKFIAEHPDDFSEAMQAMAQYQFQASEDSRPWGDLPLILGEGAQLEQSLVKKSMQADDLARVIMTADMPTMRALAADAKFAEKAALFQNLAALPPANRGMLAIHEVITGMRAAGQLPALEAFEDDLEMACQKVDEANDALRHLDQKYTTLFLAVRTTAKLSAASAQMKAERESGRQPRSRPQDGPTRSQQGARQAMPPTEQGMQQRMSPSQQGMAPSQQGMPPSQQGVRRDTRPGFVTPLQPGPQGSRPQPGQVGQPTGNPTGQPGVRRVTRPPFNSPDQPGGAGGQPGRRAGRYG